MEEIRDFFTPGSEGLLAPLQPFFADKCVNEILINQPGEVFIEKGQVMERHLIPALDGRHLKRLFTFIANENGQRLGGDAPILSGNLYDGSRVQLVVPPAAKNYTLSIRRPSLKKFTLDDYKRSGFYDQARPFYLDEPPEERSPEEDALLTLFYEQNWGDFMPMAVAAKKNIVVSGETSSGKTTYLNACTSNIPADERLITLEDTFEVSVPHQNVVNLFAPKKSGTEKSGVSMQELVQCALRLRPDRIIMGEIRDKEVLDFVSACSTGHKGSITSIHANNPRVAFMRMTQLYKLNNVPSMRDEDIFRELHEVIDVIVQVTKDDSGRLASYFYYKEAELAKRKHPVTHKETPQYVH